MAAQVFKAVQFHAILFFLPPAVGGCDRVRQHDDVREDDLERCVVDPYFGESAVAEMQLFLHIRYDKRNRGRETRFTIHVAILSLVKNKIFLKQNSRLDNKFCSEKFCSLGKADCD